MLDINDVTTLSQVVIDLLRNIACHGIITEVLIQANQTSINKISEALLSAKMCEREIFLDETQS